MLTEKQKRFCDYYIECGNGAEAARKAGYKGENHDRIASENLRKLEIKQYIDEQIRLKDNKRIASQEEVLEFLTAMMRGEIEEEQVVVESVGDYMSEARIVKKQVSAKERKGAAELLGKRYRLFTDNINVNANVGVQIVDDIE